MVILPNPPVEDAAGGEADKSLRLPCEMRSLFLWGYTQKIILLRRINPRNINYMAVVIFFACLDIEQKFPFMDGHSLVFLTAALRIAKLICILSIRQILHSDHCSTLINQKSQAPCKQCTVRNAENHPFQRCGLTPDCSQCRKTGHV